jgi:hypothetical protein
LVVEVGGVGGCGGSLCSEEVELEARGRRLLCHLFTP